MIVLPKTLSNEVRKAIGTGPVIDKLKDNPLLLYKFLVQSVQCASWNRSYQMVISKAFCLLANMLISNLIPWSAVSKAMDAMCRFYSSILKDFDHDGDDLKSVAFATNCTKIFMMRGCDALRRKWIDSPEIHQSLIEHIASEDLSQLFRCFITDEFHPFFYFPESKLRGHLLQFRSWGFKKGVQALEQIYCRRINDHLSALMALFFAEINNFQMIKLKATSVLDNLPFGLHVSEDGSFFFTNLSLVLSHPRELFLCSAEQRNAITERFFHHQPIVNYVYAPVLRFDIQCLGQGEYAFSTKTVSKDVAQERNIYLLTKKTAFKRHLPIGLIYDYRSCDSLYFFLGLLVYFDSVVSITLSNFRFTFDFIKNISLIRKSLISLKYIDCSGITDKLVFEIPALFPNLEILYLCDASLSVETIKNLLNIKDIKLLCFKKCDLSFPTELSQLNKLSCFAITENEKLTSDELARVWNDCSNVEDLSVLGLKHFDPKTYPHPMKIKVFSALSEDFEKWIENGSIIIVKIFPNIEEINIFGSRFSGNLMRALHEIKSQGKIKLAFKE